LGDVGVLAAVFVSVAVVAFAVDEVPRVSRLSPPNIVACSLSLPCLVPLVLFLVLACLLLHRVAGNRWFSLSLEVLGAILVFAIAIFAVTFADALPSAVGLSLTSALQVTAILGFTIRSVTEVESNMASVERLVYYADSIPQEAAYVPPGTLGSGGGGGSGSDSSGGRGVATAVAEMRVAVEVAAALQKAAALGVAAELRVAVVVQVAAAGGVPVPVGARGGDAAADAAKRRQRRRRRRARLARRTLPSRVGGGAVGGRRWWSSVTLHAIVEPQQC